jgi:tetratricopeptide (TPR) repeat protein
METISEKTRELQSMALEALEKSDFRAAETFLSKALFLGPNDADLHKISVKLFLRKGDARSALSHARKLHALAPEDREAKSLLLEVHFVLGHFARQRRALDEARRHFADAVNLDPECALCYVHRGMHNLVVGAMDRAREDVSTALLKDPNCISALMLSIHLLLHDHNVKEASILLTRAKDIDPTNEQIKELEQSLDVCDDQDPHYVLNMCAHRR